MSDLVDEWMAEIQKTPDPMLRPEVRKKLTRQVKANQCVEPKWLLTKEEQEVLNTWESDGDV